MNSLKEQMEANLFRNDKKLPLSEALINIGTAIDICEKIITVRYNKIIQRLEWIHKLLSITKNGDSSYEAGYRDGLIYAEKQFRNLVKGE